MDISSSSATDGSANLELTIPQDSNNAGIAIGSHTIHITTGSKVLGYELSLSSSSKDPDSTSLLPTDTSVATNPNSNHYAIKPTTGTLTNKAMLADNTWGYTLDIPDTNTNQPIWSAITSLNNPTTILTNTKESSSAAASSSIISNSTTMADSTDTHTIYYGVKVDNPSITPAGEYETSVTYTATAILPPPTLTRLIINDSIPANQTSEFAVEGTNLDTVSSIKLCLRDQQQTSTTNCYEATNINTYLDSTTSTRGTVLSFINPEIEQPGIYDLYAISPVGEVKLEQPFYVQEESICRSGDPNSDCKVDIDANMIPIYYDEAESDAEGKAIWKVAKPNDSTNPGGWYDYSNDQKKWANAVTVTKAALDANKYQNPGTTIDNNDVLGYWVYIPRYAYEVQRPNAVDRVVADEYPLPDNKVTNSHNSHSIRNNFSIHFETDKDTKKTPASSCNLKINADPENNPMWIEQPSGDNSTNNSNAGPDSANVLAKDYRTVCASLGNTNGPNNSTISRLYTDATTLAGSNTANNTTWATHPAFSWLDSEGNGTELNGIWVGKFETTGTRTNPTVKPNQHANIREYIGTFYTMARSIGVGTYDPTNNGGNPISGIEQNSHNLKTTTSHMLRNSEWGAVAYLASSIYGAGTNNVSINSAFPTASADADGTSSRYGITGCGPKAVNRNTGTYTDGTPLNSTTIESPTACSTDSELGPKRAYNGEIGVLASTTNNVYGIYDMSGGADENVMGNLSNSPNESSDSYFINPTKPPYVDIYPSTDFSSSNRPNWSASTSTTSITYYYNDICTWGNCGGDALHETKRYQSVSSFGQSWGDDLSYFVYSSVYSSLRWFLRGYGADGGSYAGLFYSFYGNGSTIPYYGFRSVLLSAP